ncbi:MotA/TolQ/ExbB proton channel family protein [Burkholderia sp. AU4i]|nr:MotA/TolQ/ExbB proton channel family protein [Burkholderia sp. AU4i]
MRRNKSVMECVRDFGAQLHTVLLAGVVCASSDLYHRSR